MLDKALTGLANLQAMIDERGGQAPLHRSLAIRLIEVGDGRVIVIMADCPRETIDAYRPWFSAALASLEITELPEEGWPRR